MRRLPIFVRSYLRVAVGLVLAPVVLHAQNDKKAPTVPTNLAASHVTSSGFVTSWTPSTDNVGVTGYEVTLSAVVQGVTPTASYTFTGLMPVTAYTVRVRARDAAGNWSALSTALTVTTRQEGPDLTAPTVPAGLVANQVTTSSFVVGWQPATDDTGVVGYEVLVNGLKTASTTTTSQLVQNLVPNTTYAVAVRAGDAAGNWSPLSGSLSVVTKAPPANLRPDVHAGFTFAAMLRPDGRLFFWGSNTEGQFGNGATVSATTPVEVTTWGAVAAVALGNQHTVVLRSDGTVWTSGWGAFGQLGDGRTVSRSTPAQVAGIASVVAVAAGPVTSYALKADGTVWGWGDNVEGTVGDGTTSQANRPVQVQGLPPVQSIVAGGIFAAALARDGTVWSWGRSLGSNEVSLTAKPIPGLLRIKELAAGLRHLLALDEDHAVWSVGRNADGELGDGSTTTRTVPRKLTGLPSIRQVRAAFHESTSTSFAITSDHRVYAWGANRAGTARPPAGPNLLSPQLVDAPPVLTLASNRGFTFAVAEDGRLLVWGGHEMPGAVLQAGSGARSLGTDFIPATVRPRYTQLALGTSHGLVVDEAKKLWAFGANGLGQLGDGSTVRRFAPVPVPGLGKVTAVRSRDDGSGALQEDGTLWMWGANHRGRFNRGLSEPAWSLPRKIEGIGPVRAFDFSYGHSLALLTNGEVWAWGDGGKGQLGGGTSGYFTPPRKVAGVADPLAVAAGTEHSLALLRNGTVLEWGSTNGSLTPTPVSRLANVTQVAAGYSFSVALLADGTVMSWSDNSPRPSRVGSLTQIVAVSADGFTCGALAANGDVWRWSSTEPPLKVGRVTGATHFHTAPSGMGDGEGLLDAAGQIMVLGTGQVNKHTPLARNVIRQVADLRFFPAPGDADADGLEDVWERSVLGTADHRAGADGDNDGLSNADESILGTDPLHPDTDEDALADWRDPYPLDYYNNETPSLVIVGGDAQRALPTGFNAAPFDVAVVNAASVPLSFAPVAFSVVAGGGTLHRTTTSSGAGSLTALTDALGTVQAWYRHSTESGVTSRVRVTAGGASLDFTTSTLGGSTGDSDGDGMPDEWETRHGLDPYRDDSAADADSDGVSNALEYRLGRNPRAGVIADGANVVRLRLYQPTE